jgi:UDP-N-acetylglucosamine acyltransferase
MNSAPAKADIHPLAAVHPGAALGEGVRVGPYAVIEDGVSIGPGTAVDHHAVIRSGTTMGPENRVFPFAVIGEEPQHLKYAGEPTRTVIGGGNTFREFATVHRGTPEGGGLTSIGDGCLLMAYAHVAHDCRIGSHVVIVNAVEMGGHVHIEDWAFIGGLSAIHQYVRIGTHAMIGGASAVPQDVAPYVTAAGNRAVLHGLNLVGLKRRGLPKETILALKNAYRTIFRSGLTLKEAAARVREEVPVVAEVEHLLAFLESSKRGITRPAAAGEKGGGEEGQ